MVRCHRVRLLSLLARRYTTPMVSPTDEAAYMETLSEFVASLSAERRLRLLEYARELATSDDPDDWRTAARHAFAAAYSEDEPEYTLNDIKR
jgi:hypothetical protein